MNRKQRRFVAEYLKDQNATQAAIRTGYSKKTAGAIGHENLKKPEIRDAIEEKLGNVGITAERVIAELGRLAFSDLRKLYSEDGSLKPITEWPEDVARCVSGVDQEEIYEFINGRKQNVGDLKKVKLWAKPQALEILARHFKLLTDRVEHSGSVTLEQLVAGVQVKPV